mgnify:CR=1 FL=1
MNNGHCILYADTNGRVLYTVTCIIDNKVARLISLCTDWSEVVNSVNDIRAGMIMIYGTENISFFLLKGNRIIARLV